MSQQNMKCRVSELGTRHQQHKRLHHSLDNNHSGCRLQWANLIGNCGIRHVTVPIATRILIANVRHIGLSNICVINLEYFKMQV